MSTALIVAPPPPAAAPAAAPVAAPMAPADPPMVISGRPAPAELAAALACAWLLVRAAPAGEPAAPRRARWSCRRFAGPRSWQAVPVEAMPVANGNPQWTRC